MNKVMPAKQHGLTFMGFIIGAFILVLVSIVGLKLIPAYMESMKIKNIFTVIANSPEMQKASHKDIQGSFYNRASIDNITVIKPDDIDITNEGGRLVLSTSYAVKVPLAANVSLYLEFNLTSAK